jgi:F-type H+-transporting ATPase subunit gamma
MSDSLEQATSRLNNIRAIEPLLSAMRTISLGTWQMALRTLAKFDSFENQLESIMSELIPYVDRKKIQKNLIPIKTPPYTESIILIIGTERGLCGRFNKNLIENSITWIEENGFTTYKIWSMGSRLRKELEKAEIDVDWHQNLPASNLVSYQEVYHLANKIRDQFNLGRINQFFVLSNQISNGGNYNFNVLNCFANQNLDLKNQHSAKGGAWPPPIFETSPESVYNKTIPHILASGLYKTIIKSSAAEHATRFSLMQDAKDNAGEIIAQLYLIINTERKKQITMEMQELASGAGLLEKNQ